MYVFIVSLACAVMFGVVRQMAYPSTLENVGITFLLFMAIDSGLRAAMNRPSWITKLARSRKANKN